MGTHDGDVDERTGRQFCRVAIGEIHHRIDVWCLTLQAATQRELVVRSRPIDDHSKPAAHPGPLSALHDVPLQ